MADGVSRRLKIGLHQFDIVNAGVKMSGVYYCNVLLSVAARHTSDLGRGLRPSAGHGTRDSWPS